MKQEKTKDKNNAYICKTSSKNQKDKQTKISRVAKVESMSQSEKIARVEMNKPVYSSGKTKGYANLQKQLSEVRTESFKQGIWKGRQEALEIEIKFLEYVQRQMISFDELKGLKQEIDLRLEKLKEIKA